MKGLGGVSYRNDSATTAEIRPRRLLALVSLGLALGCGPPRPAPGAPPREVQRELDLGD